MDRVRFGRVLGRGARLAARTVYEAVDAATSSSPGNSRPAKPSSPRISARQATVKAGARVASVRSQARPASQSMLAPVKRASRAVSLEVTGSFFALFALAFALAAWRSHGAVHTGGAALPRFLLYCAVMLLFVYFSASNFVRARRLK